MKGCVGKCVGSVGAGVGGCPCWTPSGRFLWANPGPSLIQRRGSSPWEQHGQQLSKALGALCKVRAKSQSIPKSRVTRAAGVSYPRLSLCETALLRAKEGRLPGLSPGGRGGHLCGRTQRTLPVCDALVSPQAATYTPARAVIQPLGKETTLRILVDHYVVGLRGA